MDIILSVVRAELDDIFFTRDDVLDLILIQDSPHSIEGLTSLLAQLC